MINVIYIEKKFQTLVDEGKKILNESGWNGREYYRHPSDLDYQRWLTESMNLIHRVCGRGSVHFELLNNMATSERTYLNSLHERLFGNS